MIFNSYEELSHEQMLQSAIQDDNVEDYKEGTSQNYNIEANLIRHYYLACSENAINIAQHLETYGIDIERNNNEALKRAIKFGAIDVTKHLISKGADIQSIEYEAFNLATRGVGQREIIDYLMIDKGMRLSPESKEFFRKEPKYSFENTEGAKYLMELNEKLEFVDKLDKTLSVKKEQPQRRMKI